MPFLAIVASKEQQQQPGVPLASKKGSAKLVHGRIREAANVRALFLRWEGKDSRKRLVVVAARASSRQSTLGWRGAPKKAAKMPRAFEKERKRVLE